MAEQNSSREQVVDAQTGQRQRPRTERCPSGWAPASGDSREGLCSMRPSR
eukprot:CAMPEP_0195077962 /NCGR_PEP_ID=MMETSP0448-20130528/20262_1 /TAXON_ID=66468 /ORGANISM="Heterocapsa triquestra, Strain CCMP 448" /LENGTH=49 /DNA_ID= /DNA_START= /DNA_END= /DNA_ORIENTATION=